MHEYLKAWFVLHWCFSLLQTKAKNILKEVLINIKGNYMLPLYRAIVVTVMLFFTLDAENSHRCSNLIACPSTIGSKA